MRSSIPLPMAKEASNAKQAVTADAADFETAIDAAGFGKFNVLLLLAALFGAVASMYQSTTVSYILPVAECDLRLTLLDKGVLNAITYAGMITSAIGWGYCADTMGRKKLLASGYFLDVVCVLASALSQNVETLLVLKFIGGFVICGPFAVLMSYLAELHSKRYRARIMMITGLMFSVASLSMPFLALAILPHKLDFHVGSLQFHSWHVFLAASATPSLISWLSLSFFPESPKFLMAQGRNEEALAVFRTVYALNRNQPKDSYPIKQLVDEVAEAEHDRHSACGSDETTAIATIEAAAKMQQLPKETTATTTTTTTAAEEIKPTWRSTKASLLRGFRNLRPMFAKPYLWLTLHVYLLNWGVLFGQNTMRLWLPQLFASIEEYEALASNAFNGRDTSMCDIIEYSVNKTLAATTIVRGDAAQLNEIENNCVVLITPDSYLNNIIVSSATFVGYIVTIAIVNVIGSKLLLTSALLIAGTCGMALYWSSSALSTLCIAALFVTFGSISATSVINACASLFPTSLRTMIVSLTMMFGRSGSIVGNVLFPTFMTFGCVPPIAVISGVMLLGCVLSAFLPNASKMSLK